MGTEKHPVGYNGIRKDTPLKHHFEETPVQRAISRLRRGEELTPQEDEMLLTTSETAEVLTIIRGGEEKRVSTRYIPQLVRNNRLQPASPGSGRSYLYRMRDVRQVRFGAIGRPKTDA